MAHAGGAIEAPGSAGRAEFDAAADCAAQPFGLSQPQSDGKAVLDPSNEVFAEIPATNEPEYLPAEMVEAMFLEMARPVLHEQAEALIRGMQGLCISKRDQTLYVSLYAKERFSLPLKPGQPLYKMEAYQVDFPTLVRLKVSKAGKFVTIDFSGRGLSALQMLVNVPVLKDRTWLRQMVLNTETKWIRIAANVLGDKVGTVAWSRFEPGKPMIAKIAFGGTLGRLFHPGRPQD